MFINDNKMKAKKNPFQLMTVSGLKRNIHRDEEKEVLVFAYIGTYSGEKALTQTEYASPFCRGTVFFTFLSPSTWPRF